MTDIYVIDPHSLDIVDIIDVYDSVIWRPSYSDIGDFEIYIAATPKAINLLQKNRYVVRSSDISADGTIFKNVMVIKNIKLTTDVENGDYLTVTGRELKEILNQRIVWSQFDRHTYVDLFLYELVAVEGAEPMNEARKIPRLSLYANEHFPEKIQKQITYDKLGQAVIDVCTTYNLGWEIYIDKAATDVSTPEGGLLVFRVYKGVDRSYNQTERPYVVFGDEFENLYNTEYQLSVEEYANVTLIGGEGEGFDRIVTSFGEASGLERYEVFTDAKDVKSSAQNEDGETESLTYDVYVELLREKGRETLATLGYTESFTGEVLSDVTFKYNQDFYLGDIVTVINEYGIAQNVRVTSAIESEDKDGAKLVPQFNI